MEQPARAQTRVEDFDPEWLRQHLGEERRRTELLGEIREAVFGAQDGLVSTLAVVMTVAGATSDSFAVLVAGIAAALAGVFSMGIGEYTSSKSQREIYESTIAEEREEVEQRPQEAQAEVAFMLQQEGLERGAALRAAHEIASKEEVLLKTMMEKEHGILTDEGRGPLAGGIVMGGSFGLGSAVPLVAFLLLPISTAVLVSPVVTALVLFGIGAGKTLWTKRNPIASGLEIVALAALAAIAGYFFGTLLPGLFGVEAPAV
jgi:VIT1/CCC1 family predicted Fe2+/Mn2+ transporter